MKKSIMKDWQKIAFDALSYQKKAAFFWDSPKSTDEDKWLLNGYLVNLENSLNQKDEYDDLHAEMALTTTKLIIDGIDLYAKSHPDLAADYEVSKDEQSAYRNWLRVYIQNNASRELHIIGDSKSAKKFIALSQKARIRES